MTDSQLSSAALSVETLRRELPGYRVVRQVGHGAMGVVYEAVQAGIGRRVAVKVLPPNLALRERTVKRFLREAEAMGKLAHPSIVDVYEVGSRNELHFFSMKFVEGPPLDRVVKAGPLAIDDVIAIGISVAGALAHAHSRGVLHRDVKPSNLLRDEERVVLTDFGLARPVDSTDGGSMTESGDLVGTPLYMSPEQISGDAERIDGRADVWGLGVTLYELLTQKTPFTGPNAQGILHAILHKDPPLLRKQRDDVPRDLEAVILKCLEKDSGRRYPTAAGLREDLEAVRDGQAVGASRPRLYDPSLRWVRRHPGEAIAMSTIGLAAVILAVSWLGASRLLEDVSAQRDTAQGERSKAIEESRDALKQKKLSWAQVELAGLRSEVARARTDEDRNEALQRHEDLLVLASELDPQFAGQAVEQLFVLLHERGISDAEAMAALGGLVAGQETAQQLLLRAAGLTGLGRYGEALEQHLQRALLDPADSQPRQDAARTLRLSAQAAHDEQREAQAQADLGRALAVLGSAVELAVAARDEKALVAILIERGRCYLDMGDPRSAKAEFELAQGRDVNNMEAQALLRTCDRRLQTGTGASSAIAADPGALQKLQPGTSASSGIETPALSLGSLLPQREAITGDLQTAGRGLQSIYRGLHKLLDAAPEEESEADAEAPGAGTPPVPVNSPPAPKPPTGGP